MPTRELSSKTILRAIVVVLDSAGVGDLPDAAAYGSVGSNTIGHTAEAVGGLNLPNLQAMGLGNIVPINGVPPAKSPSACFGKAAEQSAGMDTTTGHWEMAGIILEHPFPVYPNGFPPEVIREFEAEIGRPVIGNCAASGTEIISRLGREHLKTGHPIIYTSADSVFQIACHADVYSVEELYQICLAARKLLTAPHNVARVIARPFSGKPGAFFRTQDRKDFSLPPPSKTMLDRIRAVGKQVIAVGKIEDIFAGHGITRAIHSGNNWEGISATLEAISAAGSGLIFANLVDFDMQFGHRNDPIGFANALKEFDQSIPAIQAAMRDDDLLIITADHGCDPTTPGTDHSREYAPLLAYRHGVATGSDLGVRSTLADIGATVLDALGVPMGETGTSFWPVVRG